MINNISVTDLKKVYDRVNIIDLRGIESYNNNHIDGAKNIEFNKLIISPNLYLDKILVYYVYCLNGKKSIKLCEILGRQGYKLVNINGGYEAWILNK